MQTPIRKKVIVAGSRAFYDYPRLSMTLQTLYPEGMTVISGNARGADKLGEMFAKNFDLPCERYPADWDAYGRSAGFKRNEDMADIADELVAFWDGKSRGTQHMINAMRRQGKVTHVLYF